MSDSTDDYLPQWMKTTGDILVGIAATVITMTLALMAITVICTIWQICFLILNRIFCGG